MTTTELVMLCSGVNLGVLLMLAAYVGGQILDARRDRKQLAAIADAVRKPVELLFCAGTTCPGHEGPPFCEPNATVTYANPVLAEKADQ
jgi:hypothetical protein